MRDTRRKAVDPDGFDTDDELTRRFDRGQDILSGEDEEVDVHVKKPLDHVIPVRLTGEKWQALHREARDLGIGPTTLARMWLLERLRAVEAGRRGAAAVAEPKAVYGISRRSAPPVSARKATAKKAVRKAQKPR